MPFSSGRLEAPEDVPEGGSNCNGASELKLAVGIEST